MPSSSELEMLSKCWYFLVMLAKYSWASFICSLLSFIAIVQFLKSCQPIKRVYQFSHWVLVLVCMFQAQVAIPSFVELKLKRGNSDIWISFIWCSSPHVSCTRFFLVILTTNTSLWCNIFVIFLWYYKMRAHLWRHNLLCIRFASLFHKFPKISKLWVIWHIMCDASQPFCIREYLTGNTGVDY